MDTDTARSILSEQAREIRDKLQRLLAERESQAEKVAGSLFPWLSQAWIMDQNSSQIASLPRSGHINPDAYKALRDACTWAEEVEQRMTATTSGLKGLDEYFRGLRSRGLIRGQFTPFVQAELMHPGSAPLLFQADVDEAFRLCYSIVKEQARYIHKVPIPECSIEIPDHIHPPRYGRLAQGVLARLLIEDLSTQINDGRKLERSLAAGTATWPSVLVWIANLVGVIDTALPHDILYDFRQLASGVAACRNPLISDADALSEAYLSLMLTYLNEVQGRMPDYAEASGQTPSGPRVSMTISGGTFYGSQFAASITNIDSSVAGIIQSGSHDVAEALKALKRAVLSQDGLDDEQRRNLLDSIGYLAQEAQVSPDKRDHKIIKSILMALKVGAITGGDLSNAMNAWGAVLHRLLS